MNIEIAIRLKKIGTRLKRIAKGLELLCAIELFLPCAYHSLQLICWPKKEDAMRMWIMLGVGALMFTTVVLPSGAWGATIADVKAEMAKMPKPQEGKLELKIPREAFGSKRMPIDQLCVSGGRLRPIKGSGSEAITDMGPVRPGNQYQVVIVNTRPSISGATFKGDSKILAERTVSIPDCK
jgi:hypothetical protein